MNVNATARDQLQETEHEASDRHPKASPRSVEEWFVECESEVGKYLVQLVKDRALAQDLLQETFHDAYRARDQLPEIRNPRAWLYGIARNHALMALRRQGRHARAISRLVSRRGRAAATDSVKAALILNLLKEVLEPEDRALVLLRYLHGFNGSEIAEMTGRSSAVVRQRLSRACKRLLETAEREGIFPDEGSIE